MEGQIFDRIDIVNEIQNTCLVTGGANIVVRGSHKVGKSHLLDHIYRHFEPTPDTMFCRVDLDLLRAWAKGQPLSDAVFYHFFVHRLHERIGANVESREEEAPVWRDDLTEAERRIRELTGSADAESRALLSDFKKLKGDRSRQLRELDELRQVSIRSGELRSAREIEIPDLVGLLDDLQALKKRVVLFIDDFQKLLREPGLSDGLFSFLRAANMERKISTLATSQVHLMDGALHGTPERDSLFNHFNDVALEPFTESDAEQFLEWLGGASLTSDERKYVRALAGGSPFFLKAVYQQFIRKNRPQNTTDREEFERVGLRDIMDAAFREMWRRCTSGQRTLLRDVAGGKAVATASDDALKLKREGYLAIDGASARTFSPLFTSFIARNGSVEEPPPDVEVGVELSFDVFPSALAFAQPKDTPLMTFNLTCPTGLKPMVEISCNLPGFALNAFRRKVRLAAGTRRETLNIVFDQEKFRSLTEPRVLQVEYSADVVDGTPRPLGGDTRMLQVLANDYFVMARRDVATRKLLDHTWMIAAWVQRNEPALVEIAQRSRVLFPSSPERAPDDPVEVDGRVKAIYAALAEREIQYHNTTLVFHLDQNSFAQRVRPPGRVLKESGANCLEGSVLFASLLSAFDIAPTILLVPGHALVGWRTEADIEFLETTALSPRPKPYEEALSAGREQYEKVRALSEAWESKPSETIDDPRNFAIPVDIHAAIKKRQIQTLSIG